MKKKLNSITARKKIEEILIRDKLDGLDPPNKTILELMYDMARHCRPVIRKEDKDGS